MIRRGSVKPESIFLRGVNRDLRIKGTHTAFLGYQLGNTSSRDVGGVWLEWQWKENRFELRNDRYGIYPAFFYETKDGFGVSTNIVDLLQNGAPLELDDAAIAVFLRLGYFIGDDTPFKAIRAVPPGSALAWDEDGFHLHSDDIRRHCKTRPLSSEAAIREYGELFQWSTARFVSDKADKVALPLSGGRDSRHILFALKRSNRMPDCCVTVQHVAGRPDEDQIVAAEVARYLESRHVILEQSQALLDAELEKNELTSFCADEHAWMLPLRRYLQHQDFSVVFDGIGGDILSAGLYLNEKRLDLYEAGNLRGLAENILPYEGYLPIMLTPTAYRKWNREAAINHLMIELQKYSGSANPVGQFYFWNRTRREIALNPWAILTDPCHVFAPYLCEEVYDFLAALPASNFLDHTFHSETIRRFYPEYAHLPFQTMAGVQTRADRTAIAKYCLGTARYCFPSKRSEPHVNYWTFLCPRLVKGLIDVDYGTQMVGICTMPIYLRHLERTVDVVSSPAW
jgi:hypothetical protein